MSEGRDELRPKAKEITDKLYSYYGSGTGVLFGIPANLRYAVEGVVLIALELAGEEEEEE